MTSSLANKSLQKNRKTIGTKTQSAKLRRAKLAQELRPQHWRGSPAILPRKARKIVFFAFPAG